MSIIIPANSAVAGGYDVENGCRFDRASSDYLQRAFSGSRTGSGTKYTYSTWLKRSELGTDQTIIYNYVDSSNFAYLYFRGSQKDLRYFDRVSGGDTCVGTSAPVIFDDNTAWYHIVLEVDTTLGTAADRVKMYVNGVFKAFNYDNQPGQNQALSFGNVATRSISSNYNGSNYFDGYQAETIFIDGLALQADSFGEFDADSEIWKPIKVSGLTFGSIGFYLEYQSSGALGTDSSGGSNTFTANNIEATNQTTDTCTLNGCTMNSLSNYWTNGAQFSEGNLQINTNTSGKAWNMSTIGLPSGKWYMEGKYTATGGSAPNDNWNRFGIVDREPTSNSDLGASANAYALTQYDGSKYVSGTNSTYAAAWAIGDVIAMAIDLDNNKIYWSKNGAWGNGSGAWGSTTFNAGTGAVTVVDPTLTLNGYYFVAMGDAGVNVKKTWQFNFGSPPYAISSGNQDGNDYGNFEYAVPSGFLTINSANLSEELS